MTVPVWPWKVLVGGLFLLAGAAWLAKNREWRTRICAGGFPPALLIFLLIWAKFSHRLIPHTRVPGGGSGRFLTAAILLLAWTIESLWRRDALHPRHLASAGAALLFLFSPDIVSLASAWVLLDLFLALGGEEVQPNVVGYLTAGGVGVLAILGAFALGPSVAAGMLWAVAVSIRAGLTPLPRVRCGSVGCALLPPLLSLHLLRINGMQWLGWWRWPFYIWLGAGLSLYALDLLHREFGLELPVPFEIPRLLEGFPRLSLEAVESRAISLIAGIGDFWEGESGWVWVALFVIIYAFGVKGPWNKVTEAGGHLSLLRDRLFPMGLGIMASSFLLLVAESTSALLFALVAQYIMAAFNLTGTPFDLKPVLIRIILGGWVCLLLYLHRWGAHWLGGRLQRRKTQTDSLGWLLRIALGVAAGLLAYTATFRWRIQRLPVETQFLIFWLEAMGLFNALLPGSALRRGTGVLTMLIGIDTLYASLAPGLKELALLGTVQIAVALATAFLAAYDKAGAGGRGGAE